MSVFWRDVHSLLKLAIPLAATGLIQSGVFFFETLFLARLGSDTLAAGALVSWLFGTFVVIVVGLLSSINVLVAHKFGAKDYEGITYVVRDGFWLALILVIPSFLLFWNMGHIFLWLGQEPTIAKLSSSYLHALTFGILPNFIIIGLLEMITGLGQAKLILKFSIISVSLTIFFSFALIFGKFGLPALSIAGAGWGLTISNWLTVLIIIAYLATSRKNRFYFKHLLTLSKPFYLVELIKIGAPMGFMYCVEVGFFFVLTLIMGLFSSHVLAANQVALQYLGALMSIIFCIAQAITVRMGHLLGAKNVKAAEQAAYIGIFISMIVMLSIALVYWLFPNLLIAADFDLYAAENQVIIHYAAQFLALAAIFQLLDAIRIALFGALRTLRDTRFTLLVSILSFWVIALPLGYILATHFKLGGPGLWWGMIVGAGSSCLLLYYRFRVKINNYQPVDVLDKL
ncbi:MATE efflux family protein [Legionella beliardensis]|uniref:Multidrug-efflux transporter n=1 Tax=Legionella beliardensis TaxID=91822 RepID=A0A378I3X6_9GAMM|nr:MATE family efflux transporter [Legionella beliardensis]STX29693.1 MATE efflux family protein [Legionella beliardensis]